MDNFKEALRHFFPSELLVDPGWDEYVRLVLENVNSYFLEYLSTSGFPYSFSLLDFDSPPYSSAVVREDGVPVIYKFNTGDSAFVDFGEVDVFCVDCEFAVMDTTTPVWQTFGTLSGTDAFGNPQEFWVRYFPSAEGEGVSPTIMLADLPNSLNVPFIRAARSERYSLYRPDDPAISPSRLFGAIYDLGLDYSRFPFRIYFEYSTVQGPTQKSYPNYTQFYNPTPDEFDSSAVGLVTQERVPVDALRDRWGYPLGPDTSRVTEILGYDKKWIVVRDNSLDDPGFINSVELAETTTSRRLEVLLSSDWEVSDADPGGADLQNTFRYADIGLLEGIYKDYYMLSLPGVPISTVVVEFGSVPADLFASYPGVLEALYRILRTSVPAGVQFEVRFRYSAVTSAMHIAAEQVIMSDHTISVNGQSDTSISIPPDSTSVGTVEVTIDADAAWIVYSEAEGFAREGVGVAVIDGPDETEKFTVG